MGWDGGALRWPFLQQGDREKKGPGSSGRGEGAASGQARVPSAVGDGARAGRCGRTGPAIAGRVGAAQLSDR